MKFIQKLKNIKVIFGCIGVCSLILWKVIGYADLPARTDKIEIEITKTKDAVQELAHNVDKLREVQEVRNGYYDKMLNEQHELFKLLIDK